MTASTNRLRQMVFTALRNAAENGYLLDDDDSIEAVEILDQDCEVFDECVRLYGDEPDDAIDVIARMIAEWRALSTDDRDRIISEEN